MRVSPQKTKTHRAVRMRTGPKTRKDYASETISFVIKGKLTPIKTPYLTKRRKMTNNQSKDTKKLTAAGADKKVVDKNTDNKKGVKKITQNVKNSTNKKVKKETAESLVKTRKKKTAISTPVKKENKDTEDLKTKQTIEKLLKQANRALKSQKSGKKSKPKYPVTETKAKKTSDTKRKTAAEDAEKEMQKVKKEPIRKTKKVIRKKKETKSRKLLGIWNGPKRHRVASLNALAKVHCLYENETRATILDPLPVVKKQVENKSADKSEAQVPTTRTLRSVPGLRAVGKHWDMQDTSSSSEDNASDVDIKPKHRIKKETAAQKSEQETRKKKRNRNELMMDLKDMVVRKRMASLNASAILAASYSVEKRPSTKSPKRESEIDSSDYFVTDTEEEDSKVKTEEAGKLIEVTTSPKKVAVILNQDTDVTITGVYVNSTTRSTHHEGYCSIAGMQYRISATSHTQTAATAVATETLLQSSSSSTQENSNSDSCKSYTPLDALSNMQPPPGPGIQHHQHMRPPQHHVLSPGRRHCPSAFSAPHGAPYHHPSAISAEPGYVHGYYQPAGPLINVAPQPPIHSHSQPPTQLTKSASSPTGTSSPLHQISSCAPLSSTSNNNNTSSSQNGGDSSDSEVIITSVTAATKEQQQPQPPPPPPATYRYPHHYAGAPAAFTAYGYPPHYYPTPTPPPPPAPSYAPHHDLCYNTAGPYLHHKYTSTPPPPASYRRYQYYGAPPPTPGDVYGPGGSGAGVGTVQSTAPTAQSQQVVTAASSASSGSPYQAPPPALMEPYPPPPPPTLMETYPHPPHYYPTYGPVPPSCYTHPPATRSIPYLNTTYQSCPCPMQSCPKNVHIGPLTGDSKRSNISAISKDSVPLPPVALALPLEPASATGPPSPARGSAGMPPPPSPAGATYQPPPPTQQPQIQESCESDMKKRKARVGKAMVREHISAANTMLLMCNPEQKEVKREIESPKQTKKEICSDDDIESTKLEPEIMKTESVTPEKVTETKSSEEEEEREEEEHLPCVNTVAENVKVKNMKRKLSISKEEPAKKTKVEKPSGTYKDLIKKDTVTVKMTGAKRKAVEEEKTTRKKITRKKQTKRKFLLKNDHHSVSPAKRAKTSPAPSKENKEPSATQKKFVKKSFSTGKKKTAPVLLDGLIARNKVDVKSTKTGAPVVAVKTKQNATAATPTTVTATTKKKELRRKSKTKEVVPVPVPRGPRRSSVLPRWSNGWKWEGEPYEAKVFLNSDETTIVRRCYPAMRHDEGDKIEVRDCVLLKAGPRKNDLPFVAKIAYLWENPEDGEMMMSLLWYYRPEHTEQGRQPADQPDEVFASRHKDSNSVACIDDKCYVLTFHEYCRYRKDLKRLEEGLEEQHPFIPLPEPYPRSHRQPPAAMNVSPDMVFFCRRVYDFRQKRIVKNPS